MPDTTPDTFDHDLSETYNERYNTTPAGPEEFFRLGQAMPTAIDIGDAISRILNGPTPEAWGAVIEQFPHLGGRPYQGSIYRPEELPSIQAEQIARKPTHRNVPQYSENPRLLARYRWFDLNSFEAHPSRSLFRDQTGHHPPIGVREAPLYAFMSFAARLPLIDWTETLVFAQIEERPNTEPLPPLRPDRVVRFIVAYTRMPLPFEGGTLLPPWVQEEIAQSPVRDEGPAR